MEPCCPRYSTNKNIYEYSLVCIMRSTKPRGHVNTTDVAATHLGSDVHVSNMPFLGQDWRAPGEQWVQHRDGWERMQHWRLKLLQNLNANVIERLLRCPEYDKDNFTHHPTTQPYCIISKPTCESNVKAPLSDAFNRLDMTGAVQDLRRFNYVCKLLDLLFKHKLVYLSGTAQRMVFSILEEVFKQVMKNQENIHIVRQLLEQVQIVLHSGRFIHVGSSVLWQKHQENVQKMYDEVINLEIRQRVQSDQATITDLPDDCIREILLRFTDHNDIINTGLTQSRNYSIAHERRLWKELCLHHFNKNQILSVMNKDQTLDDLDIDAWKCLYKKLWKRFGWRDNYAEMLCYCRHCNALFWEYHGHPCFMTNVTPDIIKVTPSMFIDIFKP